MKLLVKIDNFQFEKKTLQASRCGQSLPKPSGGEILRSKVTTSKCFIRPFASGSYSDHNRTNSSR